jgi:hypothetical protein
MLSTPSQTTVSAPADARPQALTPPQFPEIGWIKGRGYIQRSALDSYKAELLAFAQGVPPVCQPPIQPDPLVPLKQVCAELGVGRRTVGRRIAESKPATTNVALQAKKRWGAPSPR